MIITKKEPFTKEEIENMDEKVILGSLALDLKRAAMGFNRRSNTMAERFLHEALKRKNEVIKKDASSYISHLLEKMEQSLKNNEIDRKGEDALMYSTLIQNYVLCRL